MDELSAEIWKSVAGFEGKYEVSSLGRVRSLTRTRTGRGGSRVTVFGRILRDSDASGYRGVSLGKGVFSSVHRLVAKAFVPNPMNLPEVNHEDGKKSNNAHWNLVWTTHKGNMEHASATGLIATGMRHGKHTQRRST